MALDWTTMVNHVVIAGRPADVEDAALGWQELIGNVRDVCASLERDIEGIDAFWTGKAADAFAERVKSTSQELKKISDGAAPEGGAGIVDTLRNAAQDLQAAQAAMPVPASMLGELMAARDARVTLGPGVLEVELEAGFFNNAPMSFAGWLGDQFRKLLTDVEGDAREAYDTVSRQHEAAADRAPVGPQVGGIDSPTVTPPDLTGGGPGGGGGGGVPDIGGAGGGAGAGGFDMPKAGGSGVGNMPGLLDGSPIDKPTGPDLGGFEPGSGLAGAGGGLATGTPPGLSGLGGGGLGAGGLGAGGLGGGAGLGSGGGIGVPGGLGKIPGGGSLGKPITPTVAPMGGGLAGKGGGSSRGAGGRLGAGGMAGVGGGGAAGGGRGTGAARGGGGMAGIGGAGGGAGAGKGAAGKGAGGRGAGFVGGPGASGAGHGDEDEYDSWLYEDENVWNEGTDVPPPPVLGN